MPTCSMCLIRTRTGRRISSRGRLSVTRPRFQTLVFCESAHPFSFRPSEALADDVEEDFIEVRQVTTGRCITVLELPSPVNELTGGGRENLSGTTDRDPAHPRQPGGGGPTRSLRFRSSTRLTRRGRDREARRGPRSAAHESQLAVSIPKRNVQTDGSTTPLPNDRSAGYFTQVESPHPRAACDYFTFTLTSPVVQQH